MSTRRSKPVRVLAPPRRRESWVRARRHGVAVVLKLAVVACGLALVLVGPAEAQLNGSHTPGDFGVQSGSQPAPGFYAALFYLRYDADTIKDRDGNVVSVSPGAPGSIGVAAVAPLAWYVSKAKSGGQRRRDGGVSGCERVD